MSFATARCSTCAHWSAPNRDSASPHACTAVRYGEGEEGQVASLTDPGALIVKGSFGCILHTPSQSGTSE